MAAIEDRLREPPDTVPRWHRSNTIIGAGPAGYVYQVTRARRRTHTDVRARTPARSVLGPAVLRPGRPAGAQRRDR